MQKLLTFFSKNISVYSIFNNRSFNDTLSNDIVSFEQLHICASDMSHNLIFLSATMSLIQNRQPELAILAYQYRSIGRAIALPYALDVGTHKCYVKVLY